jgi:hypothetical protein
LTPLLELLRSTLPVGSGFFGSRTNEKTRILIRVVSSQIGSSPNCGTASTTRTRLLCAFFAVLLNDLYKAASGVQGVKDDA